MNKEAIVPLAILSAGILAGCSDSTGPEGDHPFQLRVRTTPSLSPPTPPAGQAPGVEIIEVDQAFVVLGGFKLETAGVDENEDWKVEESVVIPLDLTGQTSLAYDAEVPPGTYKELEVSVDKLEAGNPEEAPLIAGYPDLEEVSVRVTGNLVRNGTSEAFVFSAPIDIDAEITFPSPIVMDDGAAATIVSVVFDMGMWFESEAGAQLDPNDPGDHSAIEDAIERSITTYIES